MSEMLSQAMGAMQLLSRLSYYISTIYALFTGRYRVLAEHEPVYKNMLTQEFMLWALVKLSRKETDKAVLPLQLVLVTGLYLWKGPDSQVTS